MRSKSLKKEPNSPKKNNNLFKNLKIFKKYIQMTLHSHIKTPQYSQITESETLKGNLISSTTAK